MQTQRQQGFAIPVVVMFVCLLAFGIPYLVAGGRDAHSDVVLAPRQSPTPTPLDRILTQQAFANLFITPTSDSFFKILVTGPSVTPGAGSLTPASGFASPTPAVVPPIFAFLTRVSNGGGLLESPTSQPPTSTSFPTKTPFPTNTLVPTNTQVPTATNSPVPTSTAAPTETYTPAPTDTDVPPTQTNTPIPTDTSAPATNTPEPPPTDTPVPPPTDTPEPPPTDTPEPPPTDTPVPGGNGSSGVFLFGLIFLLPFAAVLLPGILPNQK